MQLRVVVWRTAVDLVCEHNGHATLCHRYAPVINAAYEV